MKVLLAAINAKYIHSNLGIYSLKAYADQKSIGCDIELGEYTINHNTDHILEDIFKRQPDLVGFSCYIWNIEPVMALVRDLPKILPHTRIWLGGPEVSYDPVKVLEQWPQVEGIMIGEGEETFSELLTCCMTGNPQLTDIKGLAVRDGAGKIDVHPTRPLMNLDRLPFPYESLEDFEHRIIYYESSRGCPFSCSYCLSSIDKSVRLRSVELVKEELDFFLEKKVPQVKFVDRTFNCNSVHAQGIWNHILEHDNGITNFHFEISADLLGEEELSLIRQMRPGLIQLEIGVQSTNPQTIGEIRRTMNLEKLGNMVGKINGFSNVHQHLDLIAGLPYEDFDRFTQSFNEVYAMKPDQLQLGFLKVLKGSFMEEKAAEYGLAYRSSPPYEVLSTGWICYEEILKLKAVEDMVEVYYNSGQFLTTLERLVGECSAPFFLFQALADFYREQGYGGISHNRMARYEILFEFITKVICKEIETYRDLLTYDFYLRENGKSRPTFARDQSDYKARIREFFVEEARHPRYLLDYDGYDSRQISKMAHVEVMRDGHMILFDYKNRNPLSYNARTVDVTAVAHHTQEKGVF